MLPAGHALADPLISKLGSVMQSATIAEEQMADQLLEVQLGLVGRCRILRVRVQLRSLERRAKILGWVQRGQVQITEPSRTPSAVCDLCRG